MKRASNTSNAAQRQCDKLQPGARKRSQRGASIILALFLFLICALLASIVLAAASAVTGRHVQLAEMDQRYYNVSSTVSLMKKEVCDHVDDPVVIVCEQTETRETETTYSGGTPTVSTPTTTVTGIVLKVGNKEIAKGSGNLTLNINGLTNGLTLREQLALSLMFQQSVTNGMSTTSSNIWAKSLFSTSGSSVNLGTYNLTHTVTKNDKSSKVSNSAVEAALNANVVASIDADRVLNLNVQSGTGSDMYAVNMECASDTNTVERVVESAPTVTEKEGKRIETVTITTTRETEVNWSLLRTEKA